MAIRTEGNRLKIEAKNFPEFNKLLAKAKKEAQQLNETIAKLSRFEFDLVVTAESSQAGDIDAASSAISDMPTK